MKKIITLALAAVLSLSVLSCASGKKNKSSKTYRPDRVFNKKEAVVDKNKVPMKGMKATEITLDMKTGWNLGNSLDATGNGINSETSWRQPKTTKAMIDGLARTGFKTIRIPTTWRNHIIDQTYTIDPRWMARVKEIVDWAIEDDMYVILNVHHDNFNRNVPMSYRGGYYPNELNEEESLCFLINVWGQIALAFNNGYDEHLVFETLNEPRLCGTPSEWNYSSGNPDQKAAQLMINKFNQAIVDTIRASGGNNAKRLIAMPGYACTVAAPLSPEFVLPEDPANNLGVAVHMYTPYNFAMDGNGTTKYNPKMASDLSYTFKQLEAKFVKNGVAVYVGEYGAVNKENPEDRKQWFNAFIRQGLKAGIPSILWDNQAYEKDGNGYTEKFGYYIRNEQKWFEPELTEVIIKAANLE
ncbi:MAG: glycoside hydrolase family 5 protein [Treponema sp.]|nr:glycoside hydrolase family 5 protein [Treponema sp.]